MSIQSLVSQVMQANHSHAHSLRRHCQHIAIRLAAEHPEKQFRLDQLRACEVLDKTNRDSRWRSSIMQELSKDGIFEAIGYEKSNCPGRGSRPMMVWRLTANMATLLDWLDSHPIPRPVTTQSVLFD